MNVVGGLVLAGGPWLLLGVSGLPSTQPPWFWICVVLSVLGALALVVGIITLPFWLRARRAALLEGRRTGAPLPPPLRWF